MHLALGRARPDRPPCHQVRDELRGDRIEEFAPGREAERNYVEEELPSRAKTVVDGEAAIEIRIVDQALPPDGSARLFEVDPHDDAEVRFELGGEQRQAAG